MNIVIVRDPKGKAEDQFFFSTDMHLPARKVIECFAGRWSAEVSHRDSKQVFGVSQMQSWSAKGGTCGDNEVRVFANVDSLIEPFSQ
jgi:hypothetical protein